MGSFGRLLLNSRFYILATAVLASVFVAAYFRNIFPSEQLYYIRVEQCFGLLAVIPIYLAILITPLSKLLPKIGFMQRVLFARRSIGVAAAYFASFHIFISIQQQLGGIDSLFLLPERYKVSFVFAAIAFIVLLLMAATSFDRAIKLMTFQRWKLLHRFIYVAGVLIMLHIWLIGTHVDYAVILYSTYGALGLLIVLESFRFATLIKQRWNLRTDEYVTVAISLSAIGFMCVLSLSLLNQNHSEHSQDANGATHGHGEVNR